MKHTFNWLHVKAVFIKEALDAVRDRRSLMAVGGYVLMGPVMIWLSFTAVIERESVATTLEVAAQNADALPGLTEALAASDIKLVPTDDAQAVVADGEDQQIGLRAPSDALANLQAGKPVRVELILDESDNGARQKRRRLQQALAAWSQELTTLRVIARGVSPSILQPLNIQTVDLSTSAERAALLLGAFQIFLLIAAFVGAMNVVIDMVAGERERHSLEILLAQPVGALSVLSGKWLVATAFGALCAVLTTIALALIIPRLPIAELGIAHTPTVGAYVLMAVVAAALAPFATGLQMVAASFARTFKEAQTYLSISFILPMLVAMGIQMLQPDPQAWMTVTPMVAQQQLLEQILREQWPSIGDYVVGLGPSLLIGLGLMWLAARLHQREQILQTA